MGTEVERRGPNGTPTETRREPRPFDPRTRPWFAGALQATAAAAVYCSEPYRFQTLTRLGGTAAIRWEDQQGGLLHVAAMDVLLDDLLRFLSGMNVSPGAGILLIRRDGALLATGAGGPHQKAAPWTEAACAPPGTRTDPLLQDIWTIWSAKRSSTPVTVPFRQEGTAWLGVVVPAVDLAGNLRQAWIRTILLAVLALAGGAVLILLLTRRFGPRRTPRGPPPQPSSGAPDELRSLIARGENSASGFKSTLRTNLKAGREDKAIEPAWLKSVVAFMNSEGGTLLSGVDDDGRVVGIEADGFDGPDKVLPHVKNLVNQHIGAEVSPYIRCRIHDRENQPVVAITCARAAEPVFLTMGKNDTLPEAAQEIRMLSTRPSQLR